MKKFIVLLIVGVAVAVAPLDSHAQAPAYDHLKCYKMRDTTKFNASVTLEALQEQFGLEDCRVKGKGKFFCIPVTKKVTFFENRSSSVPSIQTSLPGDDQREDRICYRIKCPDVDLLPETVTDQFGTRLIGKFKPSLLCTPAVKGDVPPPEPCEATGGTAADICNGSCPNLGETCRPLQGTTICECLPDPVLCEQSAPQCNGLCTDSTEVCRMVTAAGDCLCVPKPVPCADTAPTCNGDCPTGAHCFLAADGTCDCFDVQPCSQSAAPQCAGLCATGQTCKADAVAALCSCQ